MSDAGTDPPLEVPGDAVPTDRRTVPTDRVAPPTNRGCGGARWGADGHGPLPR